MRYPKPLIRRSNATSLHMTLEMSIEIMAISNPLKSTLYVIAVTRE